MAVTNLKSLVGKLNSACRRALESAAGLCLSRTNYNVEIEHWLLKLLEATDGDLPRLLRHYEIDGSRLNRELTGALDELRTGNARRRSCRSICSTGCARRGRWRRWSTTPARSAPGIC